MSQGHKSFRMFYGSVFQKWLVGSEGGNELVTRSPIELGTAKKVAQKSVEKSLEISQDCRVALIGGLLRNMTPFRIISSESVF